MTQWSRGLLGESRASYVPSLGLTFTILLMAKVKGQRSGHTAELKVEKAGKRRTEASPQALTPVQRSVDICPLD